MAREVIIRKTDDIDQTQEASVTELIGFGGFLYELDLTDEHYAEMVADIEKWTQSAHQKWKWPKRIHDEAVRREAAKPAAKKGAQLTPEQRREVRIWGRANGFEVADRGILQADLIKAWKKANRGARSRA